MKPPPHPHHNPSANLPLLPSTARFMLATPHAQISDLNNPFKPTYTHFHSPEKRF